MSGFAVLAAILGALLAGAISPGPSFILVSRAALTTSRRAGLMAALGMGAGGFVFAAVALAGLNALLLALPELDRLLHLLGGAYLLWLAVRIFRAAPDPLPTETECTAAAAAPKRWMLTAFATQVSNPKTAVVYGSVFAALLPSAPPLWMLLALPPLLFLQEAAWYALVAVAFSARRPRALYLSFKTVIDRLAAVVMGGLGLRLLSEGLRG